MEKPSLDTAKAGAMRFNTDSSQLEIYDGNQWTGILGTSGALQTGGTRGLIMGGIKLNPTRRHADVDFITIDTTGNGIDFGDLVQSASQGAGMGSRTRAVAGGGTPSTPAGTDNIDFHEFASLGNFTDFGDFATAGYERIGLSNSTRGLFYGRTAGPAHTNDIDFITIASTGDAITFGDATVNKSGSGGAGNATRAIHCGGDGPNFITCDFVTIASTGNAADFGDLTQALGNTRGGNCGNAVRGLMTGGNLSGNIIQFVTINTLGNSVDFGDRTVSKSQVAHMSSTTRAVFAGSGEANSQVIDYVQIMTTGNAIDFGDMTDATNGYAAGASNGHGGL